MTAQASNEKKCNSPRMTIHKTESHNLTQIEFEIEGLVRNVRYNSLKNVDRHKHVEVVYNSNPLFDQIPTEMAVFMVELLAGVSYLVRRY